MKEGIRREHNKQTNKQTNKKEWPAPIKNNTLFILLCFIGLKLDLIISSFICTLLGWVMFPSTV